MPQFKIGNRELKSIPLTKSNLKNADCVLILTDHSGLDYSTVAKSVKLVVDTRHAITKKLPNVIHF